MISQSVGLKIAANVFGTICLGFGVNALVQPENALSQFEWQTPPGSEKLVENMMAVYGVRDIFMALAVYVATSYGNSKTLGWIMASISAVAFADGYICYLNGHGQWNHWGYAPIVGLVGIALIGAFDRRR